MGPSPPAVAAPDPAAPASHGTADRALDDADALSRFRAHFRVPRRADGREVLYLCGNSLGLQPVAAADAVAEVLDSWGTRAVEGHFTGPHPWLRYHRTVTEDLAALVGAKPIEVVAMNTLTVNLHLMLVSFFRPAGERRKIVIERGAFPSDRYAVASHLASRGLEPAETLVELEDEPGSATLSVATLERHLAAHGREVALVLVPGVQYLSGQLQDLAAICRLAREHGAAVGLDLAHAVGNVPLALHDWGPDFAVWCSYKYLNAGPGAVAGCFVHERHGSRPELPRYAGWWGHDEGTRFAMGTDFVPAAGAEGWQLSNPPVLSLAPLLASLALFREAGMDRLRERSLRLTAHFERHLRERLGDRIAFRTPADPAQRGCQLSLVLPAGSGPRVIERLTAGGVVCDWREPDVLRVAPVPLYNRFDEAAPFAAALAGAIEEAA